jgi:ATP-dependent DNA helicase DinG
MTKENRAPRFVGPAGRYVQPEEIVRVFGAGGPFAARRIGYTPRPDQIEVAIAIARALADGSAMIELGTGGGKSYAVAVPTILYGGPVIISTSNLTLQMQLASEIERAIGILGVPCPPPLIVKGRGHRLCPARLANATDTDRHTADGLEDYLSGSDGGPEGAMGDIDQLATHPSPYLATIPSHVLDRLSAAASCLGDTCSYWDNCPLSWVAAAARTRPIVIVNHALLAQWIAQRYRRSDSDAHRWLSGVPVIVDEAHQLPPAVASTLTQILDLEEVESQLRSTVARWVAPAAVDPALEALGHMQDTLLNHATGHGSDDTRQSLLPLDVTSVGLDSLQQALAHVRSCLLPRPRASRHNGANALPRLAYQEAQTQLDTACATVTALQRPHRGDHVDTMRYGGGQLTIERIPLWPGYAISSCIGGPLIAVSATLTTGPDGDMGYMRKQLGIKRTQLVATLVKPSPFNYGTQGMLLIPPALPPMSAADRSPEVEQAYMDARAPIVHRLVAAAHGRALLLCASNRNLDLYATRLRPLLAPSIECRTAIGGGARERDELLTWLRAAPGRVLLGARAFWEGVDIPADDLVLVIVDKIPYPPVDLFIARARRRPYTLPRDDEDNADNGRDAHDTPGGETASSSKADRDELGSLNTVDRAGPNTVDDAFDPYIFRTIQVPEAIIHLKQMVGRLIRTSEDRGVVAILDSRLAAGSPHAGTIRASLPPFHYTHDVEEACRFLASIPSSTPHSSPAGES